MTNPAIPNYAAPTWVDDENNWRAADAHFLRNRSVLRFASESAANTWINGADYDRTGSLVFIAADADADDVIEPGADPYFIGYFGSTSGSAHRIMSAQYLKTQTDNNTTLTLRHSESSSGGITLSSDGSVTAGTTLKVGSKISAASDGSITFTDAGTGTGTLQLSSEVLTSSKRFSCLGLTSGANSSIAGTLSVGGRLTVTTGGVGITGDSSVTGNLSVSGTITGPTSITSPIISTGTTQLTATGLSALGGTASVQIVDGTAVKVISPGAPFKFQNAPTETLTRVAGVNVSTSPVPAPGGATYPEGTIWLQVS